MMVSKSTNESLNNPPSMKIFAIRDYPEFLDRAVAYFSSKFSVSRDIYNDCISNSLTTESPLPRWYLMMKENKIIGCYGLITNDFQSRQDLWPWLCSLYVEESERGKRLGSTLLEHCRVEAGKLCYSKVYLATDHVGYYEKYGWHYIGNGYHSNGEESRIYEAKSTVKTQEKKGENEVKVDSSGGLL